MDRLYSYLRRLSVRAHAKAGCSISSFSDRSNDPLQRADASRCGWLRGVRSVISACRIQTARQSRQADLDPPPRRFVFISATAFWPGLPARPDAQCPSWISLSENSLDVRRCSCSMTASAISRDTWARFVKDIHPEMIGAFGSSHPQVRFAAEALPRLLRFPSAGRRRPVPDRPHTLTYLVCGAWPGLRLQPRAGRDERQERVALLSSFRLTDP